MEVKEDVIVLDAVGEGLEREELGHGGQAGHLDGVEVADCDAGELQLLGRQHLQLHLRGVGEVFLQ